MRGLKRGTRRNEGWVRIKRRNQKGKEEEQEDIEMEMMLLDLSQEGRYAFRPSVTCG